MKTKEVFVSTANKPLVGTLISIGDVTRNITIKATNFKYDRRLNNIQFL